MKSLKLEFHINSSQESVWKALVDPGEINKWGGGPAKMSEEVGEFSLWGGDIWGKNVKIVSQKLLKQEWYAGDWEAPSIVTIKLTHKDGCTGVWLSHTNIPDNEFNDIKKGWEDYYFGEIKKLLESN